MRINRYVALSTGMSRRAVDDAIRTGKVSVDGVLAKLGQVIDINNIVKLDNKPLALPDSPTTIMLNKPTGYVCSRDGQGSKSIYELLPEDLHILKPVGRLDKESSGLLLLTNDGDLAHKLTHPSFIKTKVYEVSLDKTLRDHDKMQIIKGLTLKDGMSKLKLTTNYKLPTTNWIVTMHEGRNRQIRRTFAALGYTVANLHRTEFGEYKLGKLALGKYQLL